MLHFEHFDGFEFSDRHGKIRTLYGCSTVGVFEFAERMGELESILAGCEDDQTWQGLYHVNQRFQFLVKRCLKLNGIKPKWVTLEMVEALLFRRETAEGPDVGWLVSLNRPKTKGAAGEPATLAEVVGAIASHVSVMDAVNIAQTVPANQLQAILQAKNELVKDQDPTHKQQKQAKKDQGRSRAQLEKMREKAGVNGHG